MLLSATVGNPIQFADWLKKEHGRKLDVITSNERRVPLEYHWVEDKLSLNTCRKWSPAATKRTAPRRWSSRLTATNAGTSPSG